MASPTPACNGAPGLFVRHRAPVLPQCLDALQRLSGFWFPAFRNSWRPVLNSAVKAARCSTAALQLRHAPQHRAASCGSFMLSSYMFGNADPFAEDKAKSSAASTKDYVHIRIQQRNGRKSLTTVQVCWANALAAVIACVCSGDL
jgi:hypothetical protein